MFVRTEKTRASDHRGGRGRPTGGTGGQRYGQLEEQSLTDAFLVRTADGVQVVNREGIVHEEHE